MESIAGFCGIAGIRGVVLALCVVVVRGLCVTWVFAEDACVSIYAIVPTMISDDTTIVSTIRAIVFIVLSVPFSRD